MLLAKSATTCSSPRPAPAMSPPIPMVTDEEQVVPAVKIVGKTQSQIVPMDTTTATTTTSGGAATTFNLIAINGDIVGNAAASKQILLANGIRIAVPPTTTASTAIMGQLPQQAALSKAINIPSFNNKCIPIITGFPYQLPASLPSSMSQQTTLSQQQQHRAVNGNVVSAGSSKTFIPLTPPPISSRKFVESTQSRIRSFSLSSHKISANNHHHQLHVQNHNNNNNSMMVDDIPPTHSFGTNPSSTTPPRHISSSLGATAGSHYMQMLNTASSSGSMQQTTIGGAASSSGSNHVTHATPRRRTISSTSNG